MSKSYSSCCEESERHNGFTLVELLVVILIIGVILSFTVISVSPNSRDGMLKEESSRLLQLIKLASDEAILQSRSVGVRFQPEGYSFYTYADKTPSTTSTSKQSESAPGIGLVDLTLSFDDLDVGSSPRKNRWVAIQGDDVLKPRTLKEGVYMEWKIEGDESDSVLDLEAEVPQVLIFSTGEMTPFEVSFLYEENIYYVITGSMIGRMKLTRPDEESL